MSKFKTRSARPLTGTQLVSSPSSELNDAGQQPAISVQHPREGSKQALVVHLLSRPEGASLDDLIRSTGWLPHTTRAALTGLRKRGFVIERLSGSGGMNGYRIHAAEPEPEKC